MKNLYDSKTNLLRNAKRTFIIAGAVVGLGALDATHYTPQVQSLEKKIDYVVQNFSEIKKNYAEKIRNKFSDNEKTLDSKIDAETFENINYGIVPNVRTFQDRK